MGAAQRGACTTELDRLTPLRGACVVVKKRLSLRIVGENQ